MAESEGTKIATITQYFSNIQVAGLEMMGDLKIGDRVHIVGPSTDFVQTVNSMQINRKDIETVTTGDDVGLKLDSAAEVGDEVYLL